MLHQWKILRFVVVLDIGFDTILILVNHGSPGLNERNLKIRLPKREKNLVETDQLLMEKLHIHGDKLGII